MPDELRESLGVGDAPEFEMLRKGGVFMQSDEVGGDSSKAIYVSHGFPGGVRILSLR